jgi:hypothetical protein
MGPIKPKALKPEPSVAEFMDPNELRIGPSGGAGPGSGGVKKPEAPVVVVPIENPVKTVSPSLSNQSVALGASDERASEGGGANVQKMVASGVVEQRRAAVTAQPSIPAGELDATVTKNLRDYPKDLWAQLDYQLLQFVKDRPTPQLEVMSKLSMEDRELITAVMDGLTNFRNAIRADNNMLVSKKVKPLLELAGRVRAQADLTIPTLALCTKVEGFGVYEPVEPARFMAMKGHEVIVYCEVENFASQLNERKLWETRLAQEVVLYTETGLPVWQDKTETVADQARRRRNDFFVVKKTVLPGNISIGRYLLKVTIVDQQANRVAEATLPVQFVAQ